MSRVDEALRQASSEFFPGRGAGVDAPLRLAGELTIDQFPREITSTPEPVVEASDDRRRISWGDARRGEIQATPASDGKLVTGLRNDPISLEQYRRLAATLHEAHVERALKTVMITSAVPREGKTLTTVNLALTLSESYGRRVLLIDGDFRRPSVHEMFGVSNDAGLSEVLRGLRHDLPLHSIAPLLTLLPAGRLHQNPHAGLSSDRMRGVLQEAADRFDWVLVDTPPVGLLSDAQIVARLVQAVLFVIRAGSTPFVAVNRALDALGRESVIGTVLNAAEYGAIPATSYYGDYYHRD